jgi:hypothetical protein
MSDLNLAEHFKWNVKPETQQQENNNEKKPAQIARYCLTFLFFCPCSGVTTPLCPCIDSSREKKRHASTLGFSSLQLPTPFRS